MKKNKNLYYWLGGLVAAIVIAVVVVFSQGEWFQGKLSLTRTTSPIKLPGGRIVTCTDFVYSPWGSCVDGTQSRKVISSLPKGCSGGTPVLRQACVSPAPTEPSPSEPVEPAPSEPGLPAPSEPTPTEPPTPSVPEPSVPVAPVNFSGTVQVDTAGGGLSGIVVAGEEPTLLTFKVMASEAVTVKGFTLQVEHPSSASRINLYDSANNRLAGDCYPLPTGLCQITNANIAVNTTSNTLVYIKPVLNPVNPPMGLPDSGQTIKAKFVSLDKVITSSGYEVQNMMTVNQADMYGREFVMRASKPVFTGVALPPDWLPLPGNAKTRILNLKIDAKGEYDVVFSHAKGNKIEIRVGGTISGMQAGGDNCLLTDGEVDYYNTGAGLKSHLSSGIPYSMDFPMQDLVLASGTTKNLYLECDTTGATTDNDNISASLMEAPTTVQWGDGQVDNIATDGALLDNLPVQGQSFINF